MTSYMPSVFLQIGSLQSKQCRLLFAEADKIIFLLGRLLMDKTLTRIRQITEELYLVRDELNKRAATQSAELSSALFDSQASNELVAFKAAVDELRQFLWHYLHEFLGKPGNAIGDQMREYQMRRAAQLLLTLSAAHPYQLKPHPLEAVAQDAIHLAETARHSK